MIPDSELGPLLLRVNRGEEAAFAALYDAYVDRVRSLLLALTRGHKDVAQEVLQITMIRLATRQLPVVRTEKEWWAWLARVTRNCWIDFLRQELRRQKREQNAGETSSQNGNVDGEERREMLMEALDALSESERQMIEARYFARTPIAALARQFAMSYKAMESKLARIRLKLRRTIQENGHD